MQLLGSRSGLPPTPARAHAPQQGRKRTGTPPHTHTPQPQRRVGGGGGKRMGLRPGQALRSPRPPLRPGCGFLLSPAAALVPEREGKMERSGRARSPRARRPLPSAPRPRRLTPGRGAGKEGRRRAKGLKGRKGKVSVNPPASASAPGSGSGCPRTSPARSRLPPAAPLGRSPPRHTRWRRSAATSVPAPRAAPRVTEEGNEGAGGAGPKPGEKEAWPRAGTRSVGRGSGGGSRRLGHAHSLAGPAPPRPSGPAGA